QGESGAPSQAQAGQALANYEWSELKQAKWDARRALLDCALGAPLSAFFHAADFEFYIVKNEVVPKTYYFGLVGGRDYQPKPAFYAAQTLCTLLAGELAVDPATPTLTSTEAPPDEHRAHRFTTARGPLLAWWQAHDMMQPFTPTAATLTASPALREPVVVEPISQAVYRPEPAGDGSWRVPLVDWPLLMVERSAVELS
ncbi:MAG: hypothetical protein HUU35_16305, partial [Armatimonadetes bacterium]|nr:hypothetical protein [Armatimonadota bacterium]